VSVITANLATIFTADETGYVQAVVKQTKALNGFIEKNKEAQKSTLQGASKLNEFIKANNTLGNVVKNTVNAISNINPVTALAVTGIGLMGGAMKDATEKAIDLAAELNKVSLRTGETVETISALKFAAEQNNASLSDVSSGLRSLSRAMVSATKGGKEAASAFAEVGIKVEDLKGRSLGDVFGDIAEGIAKIPDPSRRAGLAAQLLGRLSGPALVPLLAQGRAGLDKYREQAEKLGLIISTRFARQSDEFKTNLTNLRTVSIGFGASIGEAILPSLNALILALTDLLTPGKAFKDLMADIGFTVFQATQRIILGFQTITIASAQFGESLGETGRKALDFAARVNPVLLGLPNTLVKLTRDVDLAELRKQLAETAKQASLSREEFDKLGAAVGDKPGGLANEVQTAEQALDALLKKFKEVVDHDAPEFTEIAKNLAFDGLGPADERLRDLISDLEKVAPASGKARDALRAVLEVTQTAAEQGVAGFGFPSTEEQRKRPSDVRPLTTRRTEGPLTREGEQPSAFTVPGVEQAQKLPETISKIETAFLQAEEASRNFFETTVDLSASAFQALDGFASSFADALTSGADLARARFGDFFKSLLRDLAKAIARALILRGILGIFNFTGLGGALASLQSSLGLGTFHFQDKESSIMGQAAGARAAAVRPGSAATAPVPAAAAGGGLEVRIMEPGPFTWAEVTDKKISPRLHYRRDHLNERSY
jgi:Lambda phage tail tape-measure protein (Tape_meas_lam_C)